MINEAGIMAVRSFNQSSENIVRSPFAMSTQSAIFMSFLGSSRKEGDMSTRLC